MQTTTTAYLNKSENIKVELMRVDESHIVSIMSEGNTINICVTEKQLFEIIETITKKFYNDKSYEDLADEIFAKDERILELEEEIRQCRDRIAYERTGGDVGRYGELY